MADITDLVNYYTNLLIIQYNGLSKAAATISLLAQTLLADGVYIDVENAYNIDPNQGATAVGVQLDVIGKYVGVNRFFSAVNYGDYFAMVTYLQHAALPTSPPAFGFTTYANFADYDYNGTLIYADIISKQNSLSDDNFLIIIQLAIISNNMNYSDSAIDNAMWNLFGSTIRPEPGIANMTMMYFLTGPSTTLTQAIVTKKLLPKPMGVRLFAVTGVSGNMFAMVSYSNQSSPFGYGFSTYSVYASLNGQVLIYSMISEN